MSLFENYKEDIIEENEKESRKWSFHDGRTSFDRYRTDGAKFVLETIVPKIMKDFLEWFNYKDPIVAGEDAWRVEYPIPKQLYTNEQLVQLYLEERNETI